MKYGSLLFIFFLVCETINEKKNSYPISFSLLSEPESSCEEIVFQGMGTFWRVFYCADKKSAKKKLLENSFIELVSSYDEAFSTWSEESELKKLERNRFSKKVESSDFFIKTLKIAKNYYELTSGVFDVTLGTGDLKELRVGKKSFYFLKFPPSKLDFNGFVKGIAAASIAKILESSGIKAFYVNAGNGNLVYKVPFGFEKQFALGENFFQEGRSKVYFFSKSSSVQTHSGKSYQHIQDTKKDRVFQSDAQIVCVGETTALEDWEWLGGLSDAFSTALTVKPSLLLPEVCFFNKN